MTRRTYRLWRRSLLSGLLAGIVALALVLALPAWAGEWTQWRGPGQDGVSEETGLVSSWSQEGENLLWRVPFTGRSTPVVFDGRVCANGRAGEGITRQEVVACFDAGSGEKLWERRFDVYLTTVPWNRVGWANPVADPETGYLYVQGVGGLFLCLDREGEVVWSRSLTEELGFFSGYGGRTQTPVVDEERVIVTFVSGSWGEWAAPRHRTFAFDKRTGELLWGATPGQYPGDLNTQSTPVAAVVGGRRLLIQGNGDGWIYALEARTGETVWSYPLSKRGINTTVLVAGDTVYAAHSEENPGGGSMGGLVAVDAGGTGTARELWRADVAAGFSSPVLAGGRLYAVDNSANLHALDPESGRILWSQSLGTVGKGSPVAADGKLYVTEVNGRFHVLEPGAGGARSLDLEEISMPSGRYAEIYGSPAVAYGRVYFSTEEGLYCLGDPEKPFRPAGEEEPPWPPPEPAAPADAAVATVRVMPAEIWLRPGEAASFRLEAFDAQGRPLGERRAGWSLDGLAGTLGQEGTFTPDPRAGTQAGKVTARLGDLTASGRVRVWADPPLEESFESTEAGSRPAYFLGALALFQVEEKEGGKVLAKGPSPRGIHKQRTFIGPPWWSGYTVQADLMGTRTGRRLPDVGLVNSGYTADLMGVHQQIQVRAWDAELRMAREVPFAWKPGVWYTMKLQVEPRQEGALIRVKVWPREEEEPGEWTLTAEDPLPIRQGSPALYGYSPTPVYFDNVAVTRNP